MADTSSTPAVQNTQYGRPLLIEEWSNRYIVHPLSAIVVKVAIRWGVSANVVSFLGLGAGLIAGLLYYFQDRSLYILGGFLFMCLWHVLDGADGRIARETGTSSAFGRVIDGLCDHLVFGSVYIAFALFALKQGASPWIWAIAALAAVSHGIQAAGYEERRQRYQRRLKGVERDAVNASLLDIEGGSSWLARIYDGGQRVLSGGHSPLDQVINTFRAREDGRSTADALTAKTAVIVRAWALLNANNRTIMIAVFAALGRVDLYFLYEIIVLNGVLVALMIYEKRAERSIASSAGAGLSSTP